MRFALAFGIMLAGPALATEHNVPAELDVSCNENGAVVVLGQTTIDPGATYYLGKDCDAFRAGRGTGRWWYVASGFAVNINGTSIRFNNDLNCKSLPFCSP